MAEVLGLGMTHYPMLLGPDTHMAGLLRSTLGDPDIPGDRKDPANWTELACKEWGDDQGVAAATVHRARLMKGLTRCRRRSTNSLPMCWLSGVTISTRTSARK